MIGILFVLQFLLFAGVWETISGQEQHDVSPQVSSWLHAGAQPRTGGAVPETQEAEQSAHNGQREGPKRCFPP